MRSDKNDSMLPKVPRYEVVMCELRECFDFVPVEVLSANCEMEEELFRQSVSKARLELAKQGVIIVNKLGLGYKVGNLAEFEVEVDKACKRAISHLAGMAKLIAALKTSVGAKELEPLQDLIGANLRKVNVLFDFPEYEYFDNYEDFKDAVEDHIDISKIAPESIKTVPFDLVDK